MPSARAADTCGVNLFNPQLLTEADFTANGNTYKDGKWNGYLNEYVSHYPFEFIPGKSYKLVYKINCDTEEAGRGALAFVMQGGTVKGPTTNVCQGQSGTQVVTFTSGEGTIVGMTVKAVSGNELPKASVTLSDVMVVLDDVDTGEFIAYNPCIRVATGTSVLQRMTGVKNRLTSVNGIIDDLITQSDTNTTNVGGLQTGKQTRPVNSCPADKQCLLVKDEENNNNWYEIIDCVGDYVLYDVGTPQQYSLNGITFNDTGCSSSNQSVGCIVANDEYMGSWSGGVVFGIYQTVDILQTTPGTIVTLPNNPQSGDICVCKITGYSAKNGDEYASRTNITTDKWIVVGDRGSSACNSLCMRSFVGSGPNGHPNQTEIKAYFSAVGSTAACAVPATAAVTPVTCSGSHQVRDNSTNTCVCETGYHFNDNDVCVLDCNGSHEQLNNAQTACECVSGYHYNNSNVCVLDCNGSHEQLNNAQTACECETGYHYNNSNVCVEDEQQSCDSALRQACEHSGGSYNNETCVCTCQEHAVLNGNPSYSEGSCACESGYHLQGLECVPEEQQSCDSTFRTSCINSAGGDQWWDESTCTCDCTGGKPGSVLDLTNGQCVCPSGTHYNNGSCVADAISSCTGTMVESLIEPGNFVEGGEAWYETYNNINAVWGGKACDGRFGLYDNTGSANPYNTDVINGINAPGVTPTTNACRENEWAHVHNNVVVYGEARMVAINETTPGTIISLPNNTQDVDAGGVCVCKVKAYAPVLSNNEYGHPTEMGNRTDINVGNKWMVAGVREYYGNSSMTGLRECITDCAFYTNSPDLISYYNFAGCSNTTASSATTYEVDTDSTNQYLSFVENGVLNKWTSNLQTGMMAFGSDSGSGICNKSSESYCTPSRGELAWVATVSVADPKTYFRGVSGESPDWLNEHRNYNNGTATIYGISRCVNGNSVGALRELGETTKVVKLNTAEVASAGTEGSVCIQGIQGYQHGTDASFDMSKLDSGYWIATGYKSAAGCAEACLSGREDSTLWSEIQSLMAPVSGMSMSRIK